MDDKMIKITYNQNDVREFPVGITLKQISNCFERDFKYDILVAKVDNDITELSDHITKNCNINFYDRSSYIGYSAYTTGAIFIMIVAVKRLFGHDTEVIVQHSLDKGVFCTIEGVVLDHEMVEDIEQLMHKIAYEDHLFKKLSVARTDAIKYFKKKNCLDKVGVLKYISNTYINLYKLDEVYDYFYTKMPYSTKQIDNFRLTYIENEGFVLSFPTIDNPETTLTYQHHQPVFQAFKECGNHGQKLGINNASDLNKVVSSARIAELIRLSEANYNRQLFDIADEIYISRQEIKIVLLAGPSSSGKTTTAKKLQTLLNSRGMNVIQISTDDYFVNKVDSPRNEQGEYDFESLYCVDLKLFNQQLTDLLDGKEVEIPTYNFITGEREYKGNFVKLGDDDIIIVEGIHALNDQLTSAINRNNKYKIYICPLVQINIDNHSHIHTSDLRKLRRIVRDSRTRGYGASSTLAMWGSIQRGEQQNIYPYQDEVDAVVNSSLLYEVGVLKTYAEPLLFCVDENDPVYPEALRLINFLRNMLPIPGDDIPPDSVLREFIGGSCFEK